MKLMMDFKAHLQDLDIISNDTLHSLMKPVCNLCCSVFFFFDKLHLASATILLNSLRFSGTDLS